jgi:uncharacterized protein (TIGR03067 family)
MRLLALLAAGLFAGSLLAADDKKDKPKDEEAILGTWKIEKFETGTGKDPTAEEFAKARFTFMKDGKMVSVEPDGMETKMEFKLDPAAKPRAIDTTLEKKTTAGIYELDGDTLKIALPLGDKRPTEMKADGKGVMVMTLKRVKDEKKDK